MEKIIRSICLFTGEPTCKSSATLYEYRDLFEKSGFEVQTIRLCTNYNQIDNLIYQGLDESILLSVGQIPFAKFKYLKEVLLESNISFNIDLSNENITEEHVNVLFEIIKTMPERTFNFTYTFNNVSGSPFFPSANYLKDGVSLGLQTPNVFKGEDLSGWFIAMSEVWKEIDELTSKKYDFLGVDTSVAPLFDGNSSFFYHLNKFGKLKDIITSDFLLQITDFIKNNNPNSVGLCGLMYPCLEDFELAKLYEVGEFDIERNIYLSLHCGLGIDTYPIGVDQSKSRVAQILKCLQHFSKRYNKPLSARFVSDGKARIGEKLDLNNQYLKNVIVRDL